MEDIFSCTKSLPRSCGSGTNSEIPSIMESLRPDIQEGGHQVKKVAADHLFQECLGFNPSGLTFPQAC